MGAAIFKSLSRETKALMVVSEFEARRLNIFQIREALDEMLSSEDERRLILTLVENDLKASGYPPPAVAAFIADLTSTAPQPGEEVLTTRRLRSPFAAGFESGPLPVPAAAPAPAPSPALAPAARPSSAPPSGLLGSFSPVVSQTRVITVTPPVAGAPLSGPIPARPVRVSNTVVQPDLPKPKVPVMETPPSSAPQKSEPRPQNVFFGSGAGVQLHDRPRVLLADDDSRIRIVFRMVLERLGMAVLEAGDGNEAWRKIQEGNVCLAILDMKMPGLHGLEVLGRMADRQLEIPVIVCSAYDQLKDEFIIATHPRLRYLVKPVSSEALEKAVRELVPMPSKP